MAPPSIFLLISVSFLAVLHPSHTETLDHTGAIVKEIQMELPHDMETAQLLLQGQELRDLADELALDYLNERSDDDDTFSNIAKREPGRSSTTNNKDTMYEPFVRRGVPPYVVKVTYGKRSDDKRFKSPFMFGKREDLNGLDKRGYSPFMFGKREDLNGLDKRGYSPFMFGKREDLNGLDKRGYSPFMFGKREMAQPHLSEKRARYSPFMFGKRDGADDEDENLEEVKRGGYSALYFGKRVPELDESDGGQSKLYFGKRGHRGGQFSQFKFGKREDGALGMDANEDDEMEQKFEKKDAITQNKRFKSSFYLGKRNYVAENEDMEDLQDV
ncbi:uncharacterized protein [Apostichopus japonicus]|uniref:uncharacterized protein n=1 Tax=Stichopus japonicus TaxID=307972 RepID=UPI003AB2F872